MRAVLQRASHGRVLCGGEVVGELSGPGLVVLVGISVDDTAEIGARMASKIWGLRVFDDGDAPADVSASDIDAPLLVISQFTLYADTRKGRRPSWSKAAKRPQSQPLFEQFCAALREQGASVATGRFGEDMCVEIVNEGPMTIVLDSNDWAS